jgi:hypothetical protein
MGTPSGRARAPLGAFFTQHFRPDLHIFADDGFHHDGPEIAVPTKDRISTRGPETVVKATVRAWTPRLDADPDPGHIELQLATTETNTDMFVELTPDEARAVASALLEQADLAAPANAVLPGER